MCPDKIMMFAQFTTQEKEKVNELTTMVNALKATLAVIEFNANLTCKTANEKNIKNILAVTHGPPIKDYLGFYSATPSRCMDR